MVRLHNAAAAAAAAAAKDVMLAVGCGDGCVQLFDVRKMDSFVTLQDPVAGSVQQVLCVPTKMHY